MMQVKSHLFTTLSLTLISFSVAICALFKTASNHLTNNDIKFRQNIEFCHAKNNKWQIVSGDSEEHFPTNSWASLTGPPRGRWSRLGFPWQKPALHHPEIPRHTTSHVLSPFSHTVTTTMTANSTPKLIILLAGAKIQDSTSDQRDKQHIFDLHRWLY